MPALRNGGTCCAPGMCSRNSRQPRSLSSIQPSLAAGLRTGRGLEAQDRGGRQALPVRTRTPDRWNLGIGISKRPRLSWGAHYINIPPQEADCIHELLADIGVITGYDASGRPRVNPDHLVKHPRERLFLDGDWEEGLDPFRNAGSKAVEQWREFEDDMLRWTILAGADRRRGFAMPAAYSTADSKVRGLDRITMADYMESRKWTAEPLRWLVDFCCRDDYGCLGRDVSAWAGIHYFACRLYDRRVSEQYPSDTLTWEQGNGYLTEALASRMLPEERRTLTAVVAIGPAPEGAELACVDLVSGRRYRVRARSVVYAGKLHTAPFVVEEMPAEQRLGHVAVALLSLAGRCPASE